MKRLTKPADAEAAPITFGLELETKLPRTAEVAVGGYHSGVPVRSGRSRRNAGTLLAATFNGAMALKHTGALIIRFRWASVADVDPRLCHPFPVTTAAELQTSGNAAAVLFYNGTWHD